MVAPAGLQPTPAERRVLSELRRGKSNGSIATALVANLPIRRAIFKPTPAETEEAAEAEDTSETPSAEAEASETEEAIVSQG